MTTHNKEITHIVYSENYLVNGILSSKLASVAEHGIIVTHKILVPKELTIADSDLCSLLINILDNAMEACLNVNQGIRRYIDLTIYIKNKFLYVRCENSKSNRITCENSHYVSSKKDRENHGFGIWTIEQIAEKYHGMTNVSYDVNSFTITAALKL